MTFFPQLALCRAFPVYSVRDLWAFFYVSRNFSKLAPRIAKKYGSFFFSTPTIHWFFFQFYKHVVQSVERFIQKVSTSVPISLRFSVWCHHPQHIVVSLLLLNYRLHYCPYDFQCKPDHKVPGLYVIDSVVRQSQHQFGKEKDMFGPRFSRNITATFQDLQRCPSADKVPLPVFLL